jgi:hypothetical protein
MKNYLDYPGELYLFFKEVFILIQPYYWNIWFLSSIIFMLFYLYQLQKQTHSFFYFLYLFVGLLFFRLPSFMQYSYNPDESEFLSSINLLSNNIHYWKVTDTYTSGPLNSIPFVLFSALGIQWNYFSFRLINVCFIQFPTLVLSYYTLKHFFNNNQTKSVIFPIVLFYTFLSTNELVMYTSEQIPNLLLVLSIYCFTRYYFNNKIFFLFFSVFVLGFVPLAKFQYLLLVGFTMATYLFILLKTNLFKQTIFVALIFIIPTISTIFILIYNHSIQDAYISYIKMNFLIAKQGLGYNIPFPNSLLNVFYLLRVNIEFKILFVALFILLTYHLLLNKNNFPLTSNIVLAVLFFFILAYLTVIKTGNLFYHYLFIFICPILAICIYLYYVNLDNKNFVKLYCILPFLLFIYSNYQNKYFIDDVYKKINNIYLPASEIINTLEKTNKKIAVWGWNTKLYMETNSIQATRDPHIFNQVYESKYNEFFLRRYLLDIEKNKPALFIDAVPGFYFKDLKYRHENYSDIYLYINKNYEKIVTVDSIRIYRIKK